MSALTSHDERTPTAGDHSEQPANTGQLQAVASRQPSTQLSNLNNSSFTLYNELNVDGQRASGRDRVPKTTPFRITRHEKGACLAPSQARDNSTLGNTIEGTYEHETTAKTHGIEAARADGAHTHLVLLVSKDFAVQLNVVDNSDTRFR
jgi:hypothetical protein